MSSEGVKIIKGIEDAIAGRIERTTVVIPMNSTKPMSWWRRMFPGREILRERFLPESDEK